MTNYRLGARHRPAPARIPLFAARARLDRMRAPVSCDYFKRALPDGDPLGNTNCGCCVEAADYRAIELRRRIAWGDTTWRPVTSMVVARYSRETGYNPATGKPDDGTDTAADMTAWCTVGIQVTDQDLDVPHWCQIDPTQIEHVRIAVEHAGGVQATLNLPLAAQTLDWTLTPGSGSDWAPGGWGMHRVFIPGYESDVLEARTWGLDLAMHPEFVSRYLVGVDVALSRDWLAATGLSPVGLDWEQLLADAAALSDEAPT